MSIQEITGYFTNQSRSTSGSSTKPNRLWMLFHRFSPNQGWPTFVLLILLLFFVGDSVADAHWVETPGIISILLISALVGLVLAKLNLPTLLPLSMGVLLGPFVILWKSASLAEEDGTIVARIGEIFTRLDVWYEAATSDGISTDLMPFSLILLATAWILGLFSSWFIFKNNNIWFAIVFGGIAILTNLSFLPDRFAARFFPFVLIAMILVARISIIQHQNIWRRINTNFSTSSGWLTLHSTFWFSIVVIIIALILPLKVIVSQPATEIWDTGRAPVASLEGVFTRLFSTIPSRLDTWGRFFGTTLPFKGKIAFSEDVVGWATTEYPSYWRSRTYNEYTSQGWKVTESEPIELGPYILPPPNWDTRERVSVTQTLQLGFENNKLLTSGRLQWVDRPGVAESLTSRKFLIKFSDTSLDGGYPEDIQKLGTQLRDLMEFYDSSDIHKPVMKILPDDLLLLEVSINSAGRGDSILLQRKPQISPDLVSWHFPQELPRNSIYKTRSLISSASDQDLREAHTDYSRFITDHYLQLPISLPTRIIELSAMITSNLDNPFDKAVAVQNYLRSSIFVYSRDVKPPPRNSDGVDYFLFESKTGYSDYFASSMAILMRAANVPTRIAAGYGPGEKSENSNNRLIKDSDSHTWVQIYFPEYGWMDFEPTPAWAISSRKSNIGDLQSNNRNDPANDPDEDEFNDHIDLSDDYLEDSLIAPRVNSIFDVTSYIKPTAIFLTTSISLFMLFQIVWNFGLQGISLENKIYMKMRRLGSMAGVRPAPHQTPLEYAAAISVSNTDAADDSLFIASTFSKRKYGHIKPTTDDLVKLQKVWKSVRITLIAQTLSRIFRYRVN